MDQAVAPNAVEPQSVNSMIMFHTIREAQLSVTIHPDQVVTASVGTVKTFEIEAQDLFYKPPLPTLASLRIGWPWRRKDSQGQEGCILKNVNCKAKAGEVLAIAGPSGAGKSTLLEVLAGRLKPTSLPPRHCSLLVNKKPMHVPSFSRISGFVPQHDALFPLLTVHETLMYSARLRLPACISRSDKENRVSALMEELGLAHVAHIRVGNNEQIRGISGGERRRVSIGVEVIHDPAVLLLDEPTSGLDSASALNVVEMLHCMAKMRSRTIILSIHQPGYRILQHITDVLLLGKGTVVHHGPLKLLEMQLAQAGHRIPSQVNVLEYAIDEMSLGVDLGFRSKCDASSAGRKQGTDLATANSVIGVLVGQGADLLANVATSDTGGYANSAWREMVILSERFGKNIFRTYELFMARTLQAIVAGLALGSIYIHLKDDPRGTAERLGFFAFTLTFLLSSTVEALPIFMKEKQVVERETSRGSYRIASYVAANTAMFVPFMLLVALLYALPVYYLTGLSPGLEPFCFFILVAWLALLEATSYVAFFGALAPDFIVGTTLISGSMGAFFLFSGYFIAERNIPPYWRFMHYMSLFKYPLDALLTNEYSSLPPLACFDGAGISAGPCLVTPDIILQQLGLQHNSKWLDVGIMLMFVCLYRLLAYLVLVFRFSGRAQK